MYVAGWSFTNRCNLRCIHCYNASGKCRPDELNNKELMQVAQKLVELKVDAVNFGGGECPLHPYFRVVCKYLYENGIKLSLTTNGLTYPLFKDYVHMFHDIGVSLDFADSEKHDKFRGVVGAYSQATETIKELVKQGMDVEIVTCITKMNCDIETMKSIYELAKKLGVNYWRMNRYRPTGREGNRNELTLSPQDLEKSFGFLAKKLGDDFVIPDPLFSIFGKKTTSCPAGKTSFRIQANGEVTPCVFMKTSGGNILKKEFLQIMNSSIFKEVRERDLKGTKCENCKYFSQCKGGCAGAAYLAYGTANKPDPLCWYSPKWNVHEKYLCTAYLPLNKKMEVEE